MINQKITLVKDKLAFWFIFSGDRLLSFTESPSLTKTTWSELSFAHQYVESIVQVGEHQSLPCYAVDMEQESVQDERIYSHGLRHFFMSNNGQLFDIVSRAWQVIHFRRTHRYCGKCGSRMLQIDWEMAMHCNRCQHRCYPRISPCVIVAIRNQNKLLLAQGHGHKERNMWSILAGFVESGETLEQAVHREVFEEVGIQVKNLQYFDSQPWPFPHSLMIGFLADYKDGEIQVDGKEILAAKWFDLDDLPYFPPSISIAGQLIQHCIAEHKESAG